MFVFYSSLTALGLGLWLDNICCVLTIADSILLLPNHKCWWVNPLPKPPPLLLLLFIFFAFKYYFDLHLSWTAAWIFFFFFVCYIGKLMPSHHWGFTLAYSSVNLSLFCVFIVTFLLSTHNLVILFWQPVSCLDFILAVSGLCYLWSTGLFWYLEVSFPPIFLLLFSPTILRFRSIIHVGSIIPNLQVNLVMPLIGVEQSGSCFILSWFAACFLCRKIWLCFMDQYLPSLKFFLF